MLEHDHRSAGEIQFHHRFAHRHSFQRTGGFGDNDGIVRCYFVIVVVVMAEGLEHVTARIERPRVAFGDDGRRRVRLARRAILQATLVPPQSLFDLDESLVRTGIGIGGVGFGFKRNAGIKMQRTIGFESKAVLAESHMTGIVAVEIFTQHFLGAVADAPAQGFTDIDAFARDSNAHVVPRFITPHGVSRIHCP